MYSMDSRETAIVDAAVRVLTRYGVRRTTMNDIAVEAGVVRQTLYNVYANKGEVLRAATRRFSDLTLEGIREDTKGITGLAEQLDIIFDYIVVRMYRLLATMPDVEDLISDTAAVSADVLAEAEEKNRALIETFLTPYEKNLRAAGLTPARLSDFIRVSLTSFKHNTRSEEHLMTLLETLKAQVLAVTGQGALTRKEPVHA